jgi:putative spermidine/putrescine transport system ATP-binding protein
MAMARLVVENLRKSFGPVRAVDGISFFVETGEIFVFLGPSGCGKTTVLRCIAGLDQPEAGDVLIDGRSVLLLPPEERDVGLVFQNYALFPHLTVVANIAYGLRHGRKRLPRREREKKVAELLALVGLSGLERRKPHELSEGQKQRVALARALAVEPKVLLLDEPLSALDAALRVELRRELRRILKGRGTTAVYVTHDQEEALALGDWVAVMREGKLEQVGRPENLYARPATPFVAQFLGRGNLWRAHVLSTDGVRSLVEVGGLHLWAQGTSRPGTEVLLFFRPEELEVGAGPGEAQVEWVEYLGDRWEVHARFLALPLVFFSPHPLSGSVRFSLRSARLLSL